MAMTLKQTLTKIEGLIGEHYPTMPPDRCKNNSEWLLQRIAELAKVPLDDLEIEDIRLECLCEGFVDRHSVIVRTAVTISMSPLVFTW
jgi:hypothetical protein